MPLARWPRRGHALGADIACAGLRNVGRVVAVVFELGQRSQRLVGRGEEVGQAPQRCVSQQCQSLIG